MDIVDADTRSKMMEKRRVWRKLHLAVDAATHAVVAAEVSLETVADNEVLPTLLNPLRRKIEQVSADGAYDTRACHALLQKKGAKASIPPRKNAGLWEDGHPRNEAVTALKAGELKQWKRDSGYHQRSKAETAMYRFKQLIRPKLSLRSYNAQLQRAGGRDLGRGESHEQGHWPWYASSSAAQLSNNRGLGHGCPSLGFDQHRPYQ